MTEGHSAKRSARVTVCAVAALLCRLLIVCVPLYAQPAELAPGDWIEVQAPAIPGLSGPYQVSPEGIVDFPVVGPVDVTEVALDVLQQQLQDALAAKGYQRPIDIALQPATALTPAVATSTPAPPLQPDDVLVIEVAGEPAVSGQYTVGASGTIILPMVGEIPVTDLTVEELTGLLTQRLKQFVVQPVVSVNLLSAVPRFVNIVGQVSRPGLYPIAQTPTALALLAAAGGVLPNGDLAAAMLFRHGTPQKLAPQGLLAGDILPGDVLLQRGDTLVVPEKPLEVVLVVGAVQTPGAIPLEMGSNLSRAILLAGGPTEVADSARAYILRGIERIDVDIRDVMGDNPEGQSSSAQITLQPDDVIVIPPSTGRDPIYVIGAVNAPGPYPSEEAKTVLDLWSLAGPALPDADLHNCTVLRGQETISVDIEALVNQGDMSQNIALQPGDKLIVSEIPERVYILGQVVRPGGYPIKEGETLMDILGKAGGPTVMADAGKMVLMRRKSAQVDREGRPERTRPTQEQPAAPANKEMGSNEQISLRILAAAEWQDVAMRPRPGDVIYIPARKERITTNDVLRILISTLPYVLFR